MEISHGFDPGNRVKPLPQIINFQNLELEGLKRFAKRIIQAMKSVQDLSTIESFESDLKTFVSIFDVSQPKNTLREGNWILTDFVNQVKSNFPNYNPRVIRYIGMKLIHERIKFENRLDREMKLKKKREKNSKKSETSDQSKFDTLSMRSMRKIKEFSS